MCRGGAADLDVAPVALDSVDPYAALRVLSLDQVLRMVAIVSEVAP